MVTTSLKAAALPGLVVSSRSSRCLYNSSRHVRLVHRRRLKSSRAFVDDKGWREWIQRKDSWLAEKSGKKLPVVIFEGGRRWQYVFDGERMRTVELDEEALQNGEGRIEGVSGRVAESFIKAKQTLQHIFVPDQVRPHYLVYLKWKLVHRFWSSILHFQCTQVSFVSLFLKGEQDHCIDFVSGCLEFTIWGY